MLFLIAKHAKGSSEITYKARLQEAGRILVEDMEEYESELRGTEISSNIRSSGAF